jgi:PTH1 family peptidyl-tRNA hydrolase
MALRRQPVQHVDRLVVGLGNPGPDYENTRHNVGFMVVHELARRHGFPRAKRGYEGRFAAGSIAGRDVAMLQPMTWMNDSGRSVAAALRSLELPLDEMLVVHDHIDLPFGKLRLRPGGGTGGHRGLKSITGLVGADYHRLRVGVDRPTSRTYEAVYEYVTGPFAESKAEVEELVRRAADAVELWVELGMDEAANRVNAG